MRLAIVKDHGGSPAEHDWASADSIHRTEDSMAANWIGLVICLGRLFSRRLWDPQCVTENRPNGRGQDFDSFPVWNLIHLGRK